MKTRNVGGKTGGKASHLLRVNTQMKPTGESLRRKPAGGDAQQRWGVIRPTAKAKVGCVNVLTMGPEGDAREAMIFNALKTQQLDICGLSETKCKGSGKRRIGDYEVFFSRVGGTEVAYGGAAIAVRRTHARAVSGWGAVNAQGWYEYEP